MGKWIRFSVLDVEHGKGWAVLMLYDHEEPRWVVSWDGPEDAGVRYAGRPENARLAFTVACQKFAVTA